MRFTAKLIDANFQFMHIFQKKKKNFLLFRIIFFLIPIVYAFKKNTSNYSFSINRKL